MQSMAQFSLHPFMAYSPPWESICGRKCDGTGTREPWPAICWRSKACPPPPLKERKETELIETCKPAGGASAWQWCNSAEWVMASSFAEKESGSETETEAQRERKRKALTWPGVTQVPGARPLSSVWPIQNLTMCPGGHCIAGVGDGWYVQGGVLRDLFLIHRTLVVGQEPLGGWEKAAYPHALPPRATGLCGGFGREDMWVLGLPHGEQEQCALWLTERLPWAELAAQKPCMAFQDSPRPHCTSSNQFVRRILNLQVLSPEAGELGLLGLKSL